MSAASPLLLIHGMCQTGAALERLHAALSRQGHRCTTLTLPAHAQGDAAAVGRLSLADYRAHLERQLAQLTPAVPPVLVGHSMGGLLALQLAARTPVRALVLLTPAPPAGVVPPSATTLALSVSVLLQDPLLRHGYLPRYAAFCHTALAGVPRGRQRAMHRALVPESSRAVLEMGLWPADLGEAARVDFTHIRCPSYLVSGGRDRLVPPGTVKRLAALLPQATLRHWPRRGHMVTDDADTEAMAQDIHTWLQQLPPTTRRRRLGGN